MTKMKRFLIVALLVSFLSVPLYSQRLSDFELVESVPVETILDNPDIRNTHEVWLEMINGATTSLDIEQFYISNKPGEPLEDILNAIIVAAERGVKVRIIVDARMYKTYPQTVDSLGKYKNISTRIIDFGKLASHDGQAGGIQHAKYFIVDGQEIFLGSQNFDWRALKHIHELGVHIKHSDAIKMYQEVFDLDWILSEKNDPSLVQQFLHMQHFKTPLIVVENAGDTLKFTPTYSPKGFIPDSTLWDERQIVSLIDNAQSSVLCQFLSYSPVGRDRSPYSVLDDALRRVAKRGVKVRMIVADWQKGTEAVQYLKTLSQVPNIEVKFSSIPDWSGGYISYARVEHCKYIVVDSSSFWLGTSNGEKSYFHTSRNLGVIVRYPRLTVRLNKIFMKSWDGPYTELIKPEKEYEPKQHGGE